jgi:hypothetical protein
MFLKKFINKKTVGLVCTAGTASVYLYNKHTYEQELFNRYNGLLENKEPLSGVYLQQRQPFGFHSYFAWLLPYHQSLKITQRDGTVRHVGLGKNRSSQFSMESEFVFHEGSKYDSLKQFEVSMPIECWVDFKRKFGHYPSNIDIEILNEITKTRKEALEGEEIYHVVFGKITKDMSGEIVINSCRSAVMYAIKEEENRRLQKNNM